MKIHDQISGVFWLGLSIFICIESTKANIGSFRIPGPGFLPFLAAVVLGAFAIILIVVNSFGRKQEREQANLWEDTQWGKVILVFICLFIYTALVTRVGYLITTFGLMVVLFGIREKERLRVKVAISFITALITYFVFHVWLSVQLPKGFISF